VPEPGLPPSGSLSCFCWSLSAPGGGADTALVESVWDIISNKEAVEVNQAWAGHPGRLVSEQGNGSVMFDPLCNILHWSGPDLIQNRCWPPLLVVLLVVLQLPSARSYPHPASPNQEHVWFDVVCASAHTKYADVGNNAF
jgi:hypothetical protein